MVNIIPDAKHGAGMALALHHWAINMGEQCWHIFQHHGELIWELSLAGKNAG